MDGDCNITGARALVFISSELTLEALASKLGSELFSVEFYLDTDMDPPHEEVAMCEALGFEVWLNHSSQIRGFNYALKMETSHCHDAVMADRMFDLSSWLEKYLKDIGSLSAVALNPPST